MNRFDPSTGPADGARQFNIQAQSTRRGFQTLGLLNCKHDRLMLRRLLQRLKRFAVAAIVVRFEHYGIVDSQSAKTTSYNEERVIDCGKKVKGRKRHRVFDTLGNLIQVVVHAANIHDTIYKSCYILGSKI